MLLFETNKDVTNICCICDRNYISSTACSVIFLHVKTFSRTAGR